MKETLEKLYQHTRLTKQEAKEVLKAIAEEKYNDAHLASFLTVFMMRPITVNELAGFREALLELAITIDLSDFNTIDIVGTGGDGKDTFNISTLTSFIVAGTGQKVAKHGNYSVSSTSGSSDMLESFGYEFTNDESVLKAQLEKANICFLHAPKFHPAMKAVGPVRKALKLKTFFNILGPLVNPSSPQNQLLGTFNLEVARLYNYILQEESTNYGVVHALDGYDEISLTGNFKMITNSGEQVLTPKQLGFSTVKPEELFGGDTVESAARIFENVLKNKGTEAQTNAVLANAGMALYCADQSQSYEEAIEKADESLKSGKALAAFKKLIEKKTMISNQ